MRPFAAALLALVTFATGAVVGIVATQQRAMYLSEQNWYGIGYRTGYDRCKLAVDVGSKTRGERGLPGVNGTDGKPGQDCDCAALKAEAMEYVASQEKRIAELTTRINRLEASQCKCKCR